MSDTERELKDVIENVNIGVAECKKAAFSESPDPMDKYRNEDGLIKCYNCGECYPPSDFYLTPKRQLLSQCETCRKEVNRDTKRIRLQEPDYRFEHLIRAKSKYLVKVGKIILPRRCARCGKFRKAEDLHIHHPRPYDEWNVVPMCKKGCHVRERRKGGKRMTKEAKCKILKSMAACRVTNTLQ